MQNYNHYRLDGMKHYAIVTNFNGSNEVAFFWAEDEEHAREQFCNECEEHNPEQFILFVLVSDSTIMTAEQRQKFIDDEHCEKMVFLGNLNIGDEVYWNDPDDGLSSGNYIIRQIETESGKIEYLSDVVLISNESSETQVYASELCEWHYS